MDYRNSSCCPFHSNTKTKVIYNFQNITVLGAGKSGVGAAILASKQNLNVVVYNDSNITEENINLLNNYGVKWYTQDYTSSDILDNDLLVISPGILDNHPVVKHFEEKSKPVISEIEFASYFCDAKDMYNWNQRQNHHYINGYSHS